MGDYYIKFGLNPDVTVEHSVMFGEALTFKIMNQDKIEKLSQLPTRSKIHNPHHNYSTFGYRYYTQAKPVRRLIRNMVGKPFDLVMNKVRLMLRNSYPYTLNDFLRREMLDPLQPRYGGFYEENGILCYKYPPALMRHYSRKRSLERSLERRRMQLAKKYRDLRKLRKLEDKAHSDTLLKIINDPLLYSYYSRLYSTWKMMWKGSDLSLEKQTDLFKSIKKIREGDLSEYLTSRHYLWSIGKECHHFESPIKSK